MLFCASRRRSSGMKLGDKAEWEGKELIMGDGGMRGTRKSEMGWEEKEAPS